MLIPFKVLVLATFSAQVDPSSQCKHVIHFYIRMETYRKHVQLACPPLSCWGPKIMIMAINVEPDEMSQNPVPHQESALSTILLMSVALSSKFVNRK